MLSSSPKLESVVLSKDGLFAFQVVNIVNNGSSGIGAQLRIKEDTLLHSTEAVDILGGKSVQRSRGML